ncbi:methyl-accepting chemotaxis protein [Desulfovibrio psychrotolerans]|uniref:Methyl-accepting chemotaxis protein n=1 Tax=Desulfovibrio psychrotolerans TaxID=415242 RepID=A0A7J0BS48_9BACT|nr:methyl-accepting chemotaxis protein [Desulfovibrio psychrotolerans]GFM36527.1 methyl-accepting chemotaxis protein [Desulfovibrio psychrotolerans]
MNRSIKLKIVAGLLAVATLMMVGIVTTVSITVSNQSVRTSMGAMKGELGQVDTAISLFLEESKKNANMLASFPVTQRIDEITTSHVGTTAKRKAQPDPDDPVGQAVVDIFSAVQKAHPAYVEVFVGTEKGGFVSALVESDMPAGYDPRARPWYKEAMQTPDAAAVSKAYRSTTGEAVTSVMRVVKRGGKVIGCVGVDISLKELTDIVQAIRLGDTGYMVLIQDDGVILADPRHPDYNFKTVGEVAGTHLDLLFRKGEGDATVMVDGKEYLGVILTSPDTKWKLVGLKEQTEIMAPVYETLTRLILIGFVSLLIMALFIWIFVERTTARPLRTVVGFLNDIAAGRYDRKLAVVSQDEVGQIFTSLNSTAQKLDENMREITRKTEEAEEKARVAVDATAQARQALDQAQRARAEGLLHAATQLEAVVAAISHATKEISSKTDRIRSGTETQRDRIQTTATAMEEMNATVLEVAQNAGNAADQGSSVRDKAQEGARVVDQSIKAMNSTQQQAEALNADMAQLDEQAKAIGNIMTVISDIADQTNLLALNAAIEAARAGEAGRGFAVVADEVRKLAEKTMHATQEVGASIQSIQKVAANNVAAMKSAVKDLERATELANTSGEALTEIVKGTVDSAGQIQSIATAAEEQSAASEEITSAIEEINTIAMETASNVEETTDALRDLSAQTGELTALIRELKREGGK